MKKYSTRKVIDIYRTMLMTAEMHRANYETGKGDTWTENDLANELYHWASQLEMTKKVNP